MSSCLFFVMFHMSSQKSHLVWAGDDIVLDTRGLELRTRPTKAERVVVEQVEARDGDQSDGEFVNSKKRKRGGKKGTCKCVAAEVAVMFSPEPSNKRKSVVMSKEKCETKPVRSRKLVSYIDDDNSAELSSTSSEESDHKD